MKKLTVFLTIAFLTIAGVMLYLVKNGVSLRPALYIKPSPMVDGIKTVARDLSLRLFPDLQGADYVVWGLPAENAESPEILNLLKSEEEKARGKTIHVMTAGAETSEDALKACSTPCWILRAQDQAHELKANAFLQEKLRPLAEAEGKKYFTLTVVPFQFSREVPQECWEEKRLDFECIQAVSVQTTIRKLPKHMQSEIEEGTRGKNPRARYFFLNKYNESDFFLFIEKPVGN